MRETKNRAKEKDVSKSIFGRNVPCIPKMMTMAATHNWDVLYSVQQVLT
jgi:hypothetical protein